MTRRGLSVLVLFVVSLAGCTRVSNLVPGSTPSAFRIVAFNAEWLFDGVADPAESPWASPAAAREHLEDVAEALRQLSANYISLAEVENAEMLSKLNALLGDAYTPIFVQGTDTSTGQDVAALTAVAPEHAPFRVNDRVAYPVPGSTLTCASGDSAVSKHYVVDVRLADLAVTIIGVHFRAYPDRCSESAQREAQAAVVASIARGALARGREVIVLGDVNDFDGTVPDVAGSAPISGVLGLLKDLDPAAAGDELVNVCAGVPQSDRYTNWYDRDRDGIDDGTRERSQIDHVLVSRGLAARVSAVSIDHSAPSGSVSDHWPIVVDFAVPASVAAAP
jgi:endonuclease/exonuclease/phosphatase family metal-dependent hydrolase